MFALSSLGGLVMIDDMMNREARNFDVVVFEFSNCYFMAEK